MVTVCDVFKDTVSTALPRSPIKTNPSLLSRILEVFKSLCTNPYWCISLIPLQIYTINDLTSLIFHFLPLLAIPNKSWFIYLKTITIFLDFSSFSTKTRSFKEITFSDSFLVMFKISRNKYGSILLTYSFTRIRRSMPF